MELKGFLSKFVGDKPGFFFAAHNKTWVWEIRQNSSVLAWRIPGTGEPGGLPSMGSHRVRHDWSDLAAAAVKQKEPELDDVGNSQPIQLVEDTATRRSTVRAVSWRRPQGQPGKEACAHCRLSLHDPPPHRKTQDQGGAMAGISKVGRRRTKGFWEAQTSLNWKGRRQDEMKKKDAVFPKCYRQETDKTAQLKTNANLQGKRRWLQEQSLWPRA